MLDEEPALPEEIDKTIGSAKALDGLFKGSDGAAGDAEDLEEVVVKRLLFGLFAGCGRPFAGEEDRVLVDLIPREARNRDLILG